MNNIDTGTLQTLCLHGEKILDQAHALIVQLERQANAKFDFKKAVGPHLRHLMDHYQALIQGLLTNSIIDYDHRRRDTPVQNDPVAAKEQIKVLQHALAAIAKGVPHRYSADHHVSTVFKSGPQGEIDIQTQSTIGRELIFVTHHAVHHFSVMRHYCEMAGLTLDPDFGKAPATLAYEKQLAEVCA